MEELTLFGAPDPVGVLMPSLPPHNWWQPYRAHAHDRCDYCLMVETEQRPGRRPPVRRPTWMRTNTDGAVLLLCDAHADMLLAQGGDGR